MLQWKVQSSPRLRNPLVRFAAAVLGILLIVGIGLFALGALAIGAVALAIGYAVRRFSRTSSAAPARPQPVSPPSRNDVIDGEFVVVDATSSTPRNR